MEVTEWISWHNEWPEGYKDPVEVLWKIRNPEKKLYIEKKDIQEYADANNVSWEDAKATLEEINDAKPAFLDEEKAEQLRAIDEKCDEAVRRCCIENKIFYTDYEHQSSQYKCVPVCEEDGIKWVMTYSFRAWSGLMADVWNEILNKRFDYLDFYCGSHDDAVDRYLKANGLWAKKPPEAD